MVDAICCCFCGSTYQLGKENIENVSTNSDNELIEKLIHSEPTIRLESINQYKSRKPKETNAKLPEYLAIQKYFKINE